MSVQERLTLNDTFGLYKQSSRRLARILYGSNSQLHRDWAARMETCEKRKKAAPNYCQVRICPVCSWHKAVYLRHRFYDDTLPPLIAQYPSHQFLLLTAAVAPCKAKFIGNTIRDMKRSFRGMMNERPLSWEGYSYLFQIDRVENYLARCMFHCLILTSMSINDEQWQHVQWEQRFSEHIGLDYSPFVRVAEIRPDIFIHLIRPIPIDFHGEKGAVRKYLLALADNLHRLTTRGNEGIFKQYWRDYDLPDHKSMYGAPIETTNSHGHSTELFQSATLNAEEQQELLETLCDRLQQERAVSREEALAIIREAM